MIIQIYLVSIAFCVPLVHHDRIRRSCDPNQRAGSRASYLCGLSSKYTSGAFLARKPSYIDKNRIKSNYKPTTTTWHAPEPTQAAIRQPLVMGQTVEDDAYRAGGYSMEVARQQQLQQRMATARPSLYGYRGYQPTQRATIRATVRPTASIRTNNYPVASLNSRYSSYQPGAVLVQPTIRATVMTPAAGAQIQQQHFASPVLSHYNRLLAAFGDSFNKPKATTTTKTTTTTMTTTTTLGTTQPKITLPMFNFGRFTTTTPLVTKRADHFKMMENVQLKSAESSAPAAAAPSASDMLQKLMAQLMAARGSPMMPAAPVAPAAPSIPSASYPTPPPAPMRPDHQSQHNQPQQQQHHQPQPNPNNLMGLTGAALELAKGRHSIHASHGQNMMASAQQSAQTGHSGYQPRQAPRPAMAFKRPTGPTGYKPSFAKKPVFAKRPTYAKRPIRTTMAPTTTSTYAAWDCGRDTSGILWCAGNRIFEKKEKPKPKAPKNTYGRTQLSKFVKKMDFAAKKPAPTKWVPPNPNLGIKNSQVKRARSHVQQKRPFHG